MTRYGLRSQLFALTMLPTILIGTLLASYFTYNRFIQLEEQLIEQGISMIEPLAIASEQSILEDSRDNLKRLISLAHRRNSPTVKSIAVFDRDNRVYVTSNYHRFFEQLRQDKLSHDSRAPSVDKHDDFIVIRAPIIAEAIIETLVDPRSQADPLLGYVSIQLMRDRNTSLMYQDGLSALFMVLLGTLLSLVFSMKMISGVSRPITAILHAVERIRQGQYNTRVEGEFKGELANLRDGVNSMTTSLSEYHDEMQRTIDTATADLRETLDQIEIKNVELDLAKKRAQEAARVKSEFLANMSHELRTPLNGVIGFARQLLKTPLTPNQSDYVNTIERSARNLLSIINDILDFSKLEAGKLEVERTPFSLRKTVDDMLTLLASSAHDKHLELTAHIDKKVPDGLLGDSLRIEQVLTNLVGNAIKFTEKGNIALRVEKVRSKGNKVVLKFRVVDTGIGISSEQKARIFQAFGQADTSISRRYGGTGLGLVITQRLVRNMGGSIDVHSEPNQGSTFEFELNFEVTALGQEYLLDISLLHGKKALLFEPNILSAQAVIGLLDSWDMQIDHFEQEAAWISALADDYDHILIGYGQQNQQQLQQLVRQSCSAGKAPIVLLNSNDPLLVEQILSAGARQCLNKPVSQLKFSKALTSLDDDTSTPVINVPLKLSSPQDNRKLSILAIDDNMANLKLISAMLSDLTDDVITGNDGMEALNIAKEQKFDIIFMDIQMPLMDGMTATRQIRQEGLNRDTPIIAVTAHALGGERERYLKAGMNDYISKPIDEPELEQVLMKWAGGPSSSRSVSSGTGMTLTPQGLRLKPREGITPALVTVKPEIPEVVPKAEPEADTTTAPDLKLIDWQAALKQSADKPDLAREMISMLGDNLPEFSQHLENVLAKKISLEEFLPIIHKFHGGVTYCGMPQVKKLANLIEGQIKQDAKLDDIEPELFELQEAIVALPDEIAQLV